MCLPSVLMKLDYVLLAIFIVVPCNFELDRNTASRIENGCVTKINSLPKEFSVKHQFFFLRFCFVVLKNFESFHMIYY